MFTRNNQATFWSLPINKAFYLYVNIFDMF